MMMSKATSVNAGVRNTSCLQLPGFSLFSFLGLFSWLLSLGAAQKGRLRGGGGSPHLHFNNVSSSVGVGSLSTPTELPRGTRFRGDATTRGLPTFHANDYVTT